ncbi:MAG: hypothetical protein AAGE59_07590, partial [Cyanobacteria bacterium P01_F01_bin.86]
MAEPSKQVIKQAQRLLGDEGDRDAFIEALSNPLPFPPTILWTQPKPPEFDWEVLPPLPWQPNFVDRLAVETQNIPVAVETQNIPAAGESAKFGGLRGAGPKTQP